MVSILLCTALSCAEDEISVENDLPQADFSFTWENPGVLPTTIKFTSTSKYYTSLDWDFGNGVKSSSVNPETVYEKAGTYDVKLVASSEFGIDSVTKRIGITLNKPSPGFEMKILNTGFLPDTVEFTSTTKQAKSLKWYFGDGATDTVSNPRHVYVTAGTFDVKLVASNAAGSDSVIHPVTIVLNKPVASFNFKLSNPELLPATVTLTNTTLGSKVTYTWSIGSTVSTQANLNYSITEGGIYNIKLVATNSAGKDSVTQQIRISPYPQSYTTFNAVALNLFAWEGNKVMILSRNKNLNRATMFKWLKAMDATYEYYTLCNGREPAFYWPNYFINNRTTIADASSTCGAGCGYLGYTGIELLNYAFDIGYNAINTLDQYEQIPFYEFGRNFWFYGTQLAYKVNDPITTGYAVFMRFMAMNAAGVKGAPFGSLTHDEFQNSVINLVDQYMANPALNWNNTLGVGQGVPGGFGGATDLFASFCFRLRRDYGGESFVQSIWKHAALRPTAITTQDAVDNFFLASCAAAKKNLTSVFQSWRWPLSEKSILEASKYP